MKSRFITLALALSTGLCVAVRASPLTGSQQLLKNTPRLPLGLYKHLRRAETEAVASNNQQHTASSQIAFIESNGKPQYEAQYFQQRISHDADTPAPEGNETFGQRYWFDASYYKDGGPVFLLDAGETDAEGRLPFLHHGILQILSKATGGIGIVLEHRYYGRSFPTADLSTDSLRYLTTMQSLEDSAYFAKHVKLPGFEGAHLHPDKAPWFYYGGSYAGAKAAFARKLFPDIWWGAIASSAVTTAVEDFWEYYEPIRKSGPPICIEKLQNHTVLIDSILGLGNSLVTSALKNYFGLNITDDRDFVNALTIPLSAWQGRNWDPAVGSPAFSDFCHVIAAKSENGIDAAPQIQQATFPWPSNPAKLFEGFSAYASYIKQNISSLCPPGATHDECFGTVLNGSEDTLAEADWRSWTYQYCTEWGYFIGAAPEGKPSLVSRLLTQEYTSDVCKRAFAKGKVNAVPDRPNTTVINQWGGYELTYPRLAFIDGSEDPWLYATPHSPHAKQHKRKSTTKHPFELIPGAVHHWDENGARKGQKEPKSIASVHATEVRFVKAWVEEWENRGRWRTGPWKE